MKKNNLIAPLVALLTLSALFVSNAKRANAQAVTVTGSLSPDLQSNPSMDLVITVTGISDAKAPLQEGETDIKNRVEVTFINSNASQHIATSADSSETGINNNFYWDKASAIATENKAGSDSNEITYTLSIFENSIDASQTFDKKKETQEGGDVGMRLEVFYYTPGKEGKYDNDSRSSIKIFIKQIFAVPAVEPEGLSVFGTHQTISFKWSEEKSILYSDGEERTPGGVIAMVFKNDGNSIVLDSAAKVATLDKNPDTQGACTFTPDANQGADCIVCTDANTYIDVDILKTIEGAEKSKSIGNTGKGSISGVDNDQEYTVVLQYKSGVSRTACYNASPENNLSYTELSGEKDGEPTDLRCFIATAAYGSIFDEHIKIFR